MIRISKNGYRKNGRGKPPQNDGRNRLGITKMTNATKMIGVLKTKNHTEDGANNKREENKMSEELAKYEAMESKPLTALEIRKK